MKKLVHYTASFLKRKGSLWALVGCSLLALPQQSHAQFAFAVGPKGGVAITSFEGADAGNIEARTTGFGGLFMNFQLVPILTIQPELLISERGAIQTNNGYRNDIRLRYFDIPVLAKFRIPLGGFYPHILLGPDFAFNTNVDYTSTETSTGNVVTLKGGDVNKSDVGGLVGAGFDIQSGHLFFTVDGRYGYSFNKLGPNTVNIRNVGWTFAAGIGIRFGGE